MDVNITLDELTEKHDHQFKKWKKEFPEKSYGEILMKKIKNFNHLYNLYSSNEDLFFLNNLLFSVSDEDRKKQELLRKYCICKMIDKLQVGGIASNLTSEILVDYSAGVALPSLNAASYGLVKKIIAIEPNAHKKAGMNLISETFSYFPIKHGIISLPDENKFKSYKNKKGKFLVALSPHVGLEKIAWWSSGFRESLNSRPSTPEEIMEFTNKYKFEGVIYFPSEKREMQELNDPSKYISKSDPVTQYCDTFYCLAKDSFENIKFIVTPYGEKAGIIAHKTKEL